MNAKLRSYMTSSQHLTKLPRVSSVLIAYLTANSILSQRILRFQNPYWDPSFSHGSPKIDLFLFCYWIFAFPTEMNIMNECLSGQRHKMCSGLNSSSEYLKYFQFIVEYMYSSQEF